MAKKDTKASSRQDARPSVSASVDELLTAALGRKRETLTTGRYILTYRLHALDEGVRSMKRQRVHLADARDFENQAIALEKVGDADAVLFPEVGTALIGSAGAERLGLSVHAAIADGNPVEAIEPEYFAFAQEDADVVSGDAVYASENARDYLRGFRRAAATIAEDLGQAWAAEVGPDEDPRVVGATWGLIKCRVPGSTKTGASIRVAVVDGGMDLGHPDFVGRVFVTESFVGTPVHDLLGHATHIIGTACGPNAPAGAIPRYGIGHNTSIYIGKVASNSSTTAVILAGMNWALANRCAVILTSLGSQTPVQAAYAAAGAAALSKGCLIVAPSGSGGTQTAAPANSPTIMAVSSVDPALIPSPFSNIGKIDIAAPGRDILSSAPRPVVHSIKSGTSMAAAHVAGCAALWAATGPAVRGCRLWSKLQATAKPLPFPPTRVGKGLVQAP
jgi:subtilisin